MDEHDDRAGEQRVDSEGLVRAKLGTNPDFSRYVRAEVGTRASLPSEQPLAGAIVELQRLTADFRRLDPVAEAAQANERLRRLAEAVNATRRRQQEEERNAERVMFREELVRARPRRRWFPLAVKLVLGAVGFAASLLAVIQWLL